MVATSIASVLGFIFSAWPGVLPVSHCVKRVSVAPLPHYLFWLNKVLAPAASGDWRARDRGINSGAVYAAKALARNEPEVKLPVGLIKTKKILSGCAGNGLRLGAGHVVSVLGVFFHGSCARAHPWR